ncbi:LysR substrate-binding domain-containing protein [Streptomyces sp. NBC_01445]|uniref:LysR substrate-binding domain-containing protein n=1 Tax=Streptomyces sp. NBC_01445 TaxID=2903869 RepID=UPI003FA376C3
MQGSRLADLADEQFITLPVGYGNRDLVDRAFAITGIERRVALEVTDSARPPPSSGVASASRSCASSRHRPSRRECAY